MLEKFIDELLLKLFDHQSYQQFIICLINSDVYIPCVNFSSKTVPIWMGDNGEKFVPFFSTIENLRNVCFLDLKSFDENQYIKMRGREFFLGLENLSAVLNPNLSNVKEFSINETKWIKQQFGSLWLLNFLLGNEVLLFQPKNKPVTLLKKLTFFLKNMILLDWLYIQRSEFSTKSMI